MSTIKDPILMQYMNPTQIRPKQDGGHNMKETSDY